MGGWSIFCAMRYKKTKNPTTTLEVSGAKQRYCTWSLHTAPLRGGQSTQVTHKSHLTDSPYVRYQLVPLGEWARAPVACFCSPLCCSTGLNKALPDLLLWALISFQWLESLRIQVGSILGSTLWDTCGALCPLTGKGSRHLWDHQMQLPSGWQAATWNSCFKITTFGNSAFLAPEGLVSLFRKGFPLIVSPFSLTTFPFPFASPDFSLLLLSLASPTSVLSFCESGLDITRLSEEMNRCTEKPVNYEKVQDLTQEKDGNSAVFLSWVSEPFRRDTNTDPESAETSSLLAMCFISHYAPDIREKIAKAWG